MKTKSTTIYICEHCKNAPQTGKFRRKYKWKTERGFNNHSCYKDILIKQEKEKVRNEEQQKINKTIYKKALLKFIEESPYKIGDVIHFVGYTVTRPTHEMRGSRMVKVRYEEGRSYWNSSGIITEVRVNEYIVDNRISVLSNNVCENKDEAYNEARRRDASYKEHCEFSSRCR